MAPRHDLLNFLIGAFPTHNVYGSPPGKVELPAIVIAPDSPYVSRSTFCVYEWHFQVGFIVGRTSDNQDLDLIDDLVEQAWKVFRTQSPTLTIAETRSIDAMEIGGTPYVAAVFPVTMKGYSDG